jgi:hypothetical protein
MKLQSTQIILTISTQPTGAIIQQQRAELTLTISDYFERLWFKLLIVLAALLLAGDDLIGQTVYETRRQLDITRLGLFVMFTGARLCFAEIAK